MNYQTRRDLLAAAPASLAATAGCLDRDNEDVPPHLYAIYFSNQTHDTVNVHLRVTLSGNVVFERSHTVPSKHRPILVSAGEVDRPGSYVISLQTENPKTTTRVTIEEHATQDHPCVHPIFEAYLGGVSPDVRTYDRQECRGEES